jgi:glycosyltransferase involved in cell wall biosynthesis
MDDLLSIIIPYFNAGMTIEQTLVSALNQTYKSYEVIVVNDGSNEENSRIIIDLNKQYNFTLIHQANQGLSAARNTAINRSNGKAFLPLDADDTITNDALELLSKQGFKPGCAYVYSDLNLFGAESRIVKLPVFSDLGLLSKNILTCTALIKKEAWEKVKGYDERLIQGFEDWDFYLKLLNEDLRGQHIDKRVFNYRKHTFNQSMLDQALLKEESLILDIVNNNFNLYSKKFKTQSIDVMIKKIHFYRMIEYSKNCKFWKIVKTTLGYEPKVFKTDPVEDFNLYLLELNKANFFYYWRLLKRIQLKIKEAIFREKTIELKFL